MVRPATTHDIPALIELQKSLAEEKTIWGYVADTQAEWNRRDLAWTLLAEQDGHLVGFIHGAPREYAGECVFSPPDRVLEIVDFFIAKEHRSQGLGHALFAALEQVAAKTGFTHLRIYSASKRFDDIVRFYRRCGFAPWYLEMTKSLPPRTE